MRCNGSVPPSCSLVIGRRRTMRKKAREHCEEATKALRIFISQLIKFRIVCVTGLLVFFALAGTWAVIGGRLVGVIKLNGFGSPGIHVLFVWLVEEAVRHIFPGDWLFYPRVCFTLRSVDRSIMCSCMKHSVQRALWPFRDFFFFYTLNISCLLWRNEVIVGWFHFCVCNSRPNYTQTAQ